MLKKLSICAILAAAILTGCTSNPAAKLSMKSQGTVEKVSKIYGEQNPQIVDVKITQEETTKKPLYIVFLKGNFQKGEQKSKKLEFSMNEDDKKVWALTSDSWQENEIEVSN